MKLTLMFIALCLQAHAQTLNCNQLELVSAGPFNGITIHDDLAWGTNSVGIFTSRDGKRWDPFYEDDHDWRGIAFGNGVTVAYNSDTYIVSNGENKPWQSNSQGFSKMIFADGVFIATGTIFSTFFESSDGQDWQPLDIKNAQLMAFKNKALILEGNQLHIRDQGTWSIVELEITSPKRLYKHGDWVYINSRDGSMHRSSDLMNWQSLETVLNIELGYSSGGTFLCYADGSWMVTTDGLDWQEASFSIPDFTWATTMTAFKGEFLIQTFQGIFGGNPSTGWRLNTPGETFSHGASDGNVLVLAGSSGVVMTPDENQWFLAEPNADFNISHIPLADLIHDGTQFLATGPDGIYASEDGLNWIHAKKTGEDDDVRHLVTSPNAVLAYSNYNRNAFLKQGSSHWEKVTLPFNPSELVWTGKRFLGYKSYIGFLYSEDGLNWKTWVPLDGHVEELSTITPWQGKLLAKGGNDITRSTDGLSWSESNHISRQTNQYFHGRVGNYLYRQDHIHELKLGVDPYHWADVPLEGLLHPIIEWNGKVWVSANGFWRVSCVEPTEPPVLHKEMVIPWVVDNQTWKTRIALTNTSNREAHIVLTAVTEDSQQTLEITVMANSVYAAQAETLFPGLTGYAIYLDSDQREIQPSFLTINVDPKIGGRSPSQSRAIYREDYAKKLLYGYVPGNQNAAIVVVAPESEGGAAIVLKNAAGDYIDEKYIEVSNKPFAMLVRDLFWDSQIPEHAVIEVQSSHYLAGMTFIFSNEGQPSMTQAIPFHKE